MHNYITIRFYHPGFSIGLQDVRNAWLLQNSPVHLPATVHRGALVYRLPGGKRISYRQLKKGLVKRTIHLPVPYPLLPF